MLHSMSRREHGFTLIEVMIVVAIVAILAAVAIPSYQSQVRSSNRADAQGALMGLAQAMERHFTERGTYAGSHADGKPNIFPDQAPLEGGRKLYNLVITDATSSGYTLEARPIDGTIQVADGTLRLTSSGFREREVGGDSMPW